MEVFRWQHHPIYQKHRTTGLFRHARHVLPDRAGQSAPPDRVVRSARLGLREYREA